MSEQLSYTPRQQAALKNATEPKQGDVWRDNDPRSTGRVFRVIGLVLKDRQQFAVVENGRSGRGRRARIGFWRFVQTRRDGYTLVERDGQAV